MYFARVKYMAKKVKGLKSEEKILHAGFLSIAQHGFYKTTFQTISTISKMSDSSIVKVFGSKKNIFPMVAEFAWKGAIERTLESIQDKAPQSREEWLESYMEASIEIFTENKQTQAFYMNFYCHSLYDAKVLKLHQTIKKEAWNRIAEFLNPDFDDNTKQLHARYIHDKLTGLLLNHSIDQDEEQIHREKRLLVAWIACSSHRLGSGR